MVPANSSLVETRVRHILFQILLRSPPDSGKSARQSAVTKFPVLFMGSARNTESSAAQRTLATGNTRRYTTDMERRSNADISDNREHKAYPPPQPPNSQLSKFLQTCCCQDQGGKDTGNEPCSGARINLK